MKWKHVGSALAAALCCFSSVWAQMAPQQRANQQSLDAWRTQNMQRCGDEHGHGCRQQGGSRGPSAAEVRAWHERERKVQAEIAELRATPFYMALAFDAPNNRVLSRGGFYTEKRAVEEVLRACGSQCELIATFANACGVITFPSRRFLAGGILLAKDISVGVDADDSKAAEKSIQACEIKNGRGKCVYSSAKTNNGTAFCTGYDYRMYGYR